MNHPGVMEEVLAKALARAVLVRLGHLKSSSRLQAASIKQAHKAVRRKRAV
jgi:hypothetical protein